MKTSDSYEEAEIENNNYKDEYYELNRLETGSDKVSSIGSLNN